MDTPTNLTEPTDFEREYQDVQIRASGTLTFVYALRECFEVGLPHLQPALVPYLDNSVRATMGDSFPKIKEATHRRLLEGMAAHKVELARSLIDAASVVVLQASLDSAVNDYLLLLAKVDPAIFESEVGDEALPLKIMREKPYEELLSSKTLSYARSASAKSLPKKIQLVLDRCFRESVELIPSGFRFDLDRVRSFDDLRHDIAHGRGMGITIQNMDEVILFLWHTTLSLGAVVGSRLNFKVDPAREIGRPRATVRVVAL
jgi:hypothetical protein